MELRIFQNKLLGICPEVLRNATKLSVGVLCVPVEIRTGHLPDVRLKVYDLSRLVRPVNQSVPNGARAAFRKNQYS